MLNETGLLHLKAGNTGNPETGQLAIVGMGIAHWGHLTNQAQMVLDRADSVYYAASDLTMIAWFKEHYPRSQPFPPYREAKTLAETYGQWVDVLLADLAKGKRVAAAFYGHPGFGVMASHEAMGKARAKGYDVVMLPAISSLDCLLADLGVDPFEGLAINEATDFVTRRFIPDPAQNLVLTQVGMMGIGRPGDANRHGIRLMVQKLGASHGYDHRVTLYRAAQTPSDGPLIRKVPLNRLGDADVGCLTTLFVPRIFRRNMDPGLGKRLGLFQAQPAPVV